MLGTKKDTKRHSKRPAKSTGGGLAQYGLFDIPNNLGDVDETMRDVASDDNDEDLEAELAALTSGVGGVTKRAKAPAPPIPSAQLDAMVVDSLKDVGLDEELSADDDDPDLLNELNEITGNYESAIPEPMKSDNDAPASATTIELLEDRIAMYKLAVQKAKVENENSRARRFGRGLKTLEEMIRTVRQGHPIDNSEIPPILPPSATSNDSEVPTVSGISVPQLEPAVHDAQARPHDPTNISIEPNKPVDTEILRLLEERRQEYRSAALAWKRAGNNDEALELVRLAKCFDPVISAAKAGEAVDLADMPVSPNLPAQSSPTSSIVEPRKAESETQHERPTITPAALTEVSENGDILGTVLKERLEVYRRSKVAAETEGNSSKARRYGRICKQFEDAVKQHSRGESVPIDELPTPPGFPTIPSLLSEAATPCIPASAASPVGPGDIDEPVDMDGEKSLPTPTKQGMESPIVPPRLKPGLKKKTARTRADKQMYELQQRQHELKQAALSAKQDGDTDLARMYLRQAKGIQPLIQASMAGLPVDMNSVPLSPLAKLRLDQPIEADDFTNTDIIFDKEKNSNKDGNGGDDVQIYENLETQLVRQVKTCLSTRDHSKALGDVAGYNRWERLALGYTRDLDMLRVRRRDGHPPPQHRYETKTFAVVQSCTDLKDTDMEITILRGVNYSREADTYVIVEFPYPPDSPVINRTSTVRESSNPEYLAVFPLNGGIDRNSRQCQRVFKRHGLKCQVWSKGGFFRSDSLLGTVTVKLQLLETRCILHDSFPLMDGRKAVGGKLEVKVRLRDPILTKEIEQSTDQWLVIEH